MEAKVIKFQDFGAVEFPKTAEVYLVLNRVIHFLDMQYSFGETYVYVILDFLNIKWTCFFYALNFV